MIGITTTEAGSMVMPKLLDGSEDLTYESVQTLWRVAANPIPTEEAAKRIGKTDHILAL